MGLFQATQREQIDGELPHPPTKDSTELMGEVQEGKLAYSPESGGQNPSGGILGPADHPVRTEEGLGLDNLKESITVEILPPAKKSYCLEGNSIEDKLTQGNTGSCSRNSQEPSSKEKCNQEDTVPSVDEKTKIEEKESSATDWNFKKGKCLEHDALGEKRLIST